MHGGHVFTPNESLVQAAKSYAESRRINVDFQSPFGFGSDGTVWRTTHGSALKILFRDDNYAVERDCYLRLREAGTRHVGSLNVPILVDYDDELRAIEMTIVRPPYLLDFGKVYLDDPPPYWDDVQLMANFYEEKAPLFGRNWPRVLKAMASLRLHGIYYVDPRPQNIDFGDEEDDSEL
jgi:hypothetical protein